MISAIGGIGSRGKGDAAENTRAASCIRIRARREDRRDCHRFFGVALLDIDRHGIL